MSDTRQNEELPFVQVVIVAAIVAAAVLAVGTVLLWVRGLAG